MCRVKFWCEGLQVLQTPHDRILIGICVSCYPRLYCHSSPAFLMTNGTGSKPQYQSCFLWISWWLLVTTPWHASFSMITLDKVSISLPLSKWTDLQSAGLPEPNRHTRLITGLIGLRHAKRSLIGPLDAKFYSGQDRHTDRQTHRHWRIRILGLPRASSGRQSCQVHGNTICPDCSSRNIFSHPCQK